MLLCTEDTTYIYISYLSWCKQMQWEKRIHKSLNSMCNEIGVPLAHCRSASDRDVLEQKWAELSTYDIGEL